MKTTAPTIAPPTDSAAQKFGGQLGELSYAILYDLQLHGKSNILDIEMRIGRNKISSRINTLASRGYVRRIQDPAFTGFQINNKGRAAIGVTVPDECKPEPRTRICNASMLGTTLNPVTDTHMGRIGLARCG